ncbi:C40 family peptidase [Streptomyces sp. PKU-EA00015]|uniref:C40 family peptidase n=1 Tax=Streptomyces sp. PKU-EA00015 TaxID=2748326 RepID=UPI0015A424A6|nr:bifunctional lytic transglycosylase/C40 family peptidase [Streptomyces sp. PKU-EA00015]NWF30877.1 C40 family peptidase [Streptomyces sp. PKU-EA00015]
MKKAVGGIAAVAVGFPVGIIGLVLGMAGADATAQGQVLSGLNLAQMPAAGRHYASWYVKAAESVASECPQLSPALLAAQGYQESGFNPNIEGPPTNYGKAKGIAQFIDSTWATWGKDEDGDGTELGAKDPEDAIMAQARYMCSMVKKAQRSGHDDNPVRLALAGYNAGWGRVEQYGGVPPESFAQGQTYHYVRIITATAEKWSKAIGGGGISGLGTGSGPDAVRRGATQIGVPYSWGGGTPSGPSLGFCGGGGYLRGKCVAATTEGFDCSSLTQYAWWPSTKLPRTAADQYAATASRPVAKSDLQPGDLMFWSKGSTSAIYHVAIYAGDSKVLHAPRTGRTVSVVPLAEAMPARDYVGATRPGA